jgi:mannose-6-phosphate isomerase
MAIALAPFTALCGFLPLARIASYLQSTPEFCSLIPTPIISAFHKILAPLFGLPCTPIHKAVLKALFSAVMTAPPDRVHANLLALVERYSSSESAIHDTELPLVDLVLRLNSQFPGDVGVFCVFLLNYIILKPGEAIFLGAGEPHAYISGGQRI